MEFFTSADTEAESDLLQQRLTIRSLPDFCSAIEKVLQDQGQTGEIYCLWGQFEVHRQEINGGVRFTLPGCPNALAWTVTTSYPPAPEKISIHCTINRTSHEPDFIESIEYFVDAWRQGLEQVRW